MQGQPSCAKKSETELTVVGGNSVGDGSAELVDDEDDEDIVIRSRPVDVLLYSQVANGGAEAGRQLAALPLLVGTARFLYQFFHHNSLDTSIYILHKRISQFDLSACVISFIAPSLV